MTKLLTLGIDKCRSNGGSIRKINCKRKKKNHYKDYDENESQLGDYNMTCCCNVKCDPIEKPARQLLEEYSNVWWPNSLHKKTNFTKIWYSEPLKHLKL